MASATSATGLTVGCNESLLLAVPFQNVLTGIVPNVGSIAAKTAKLDVIDMWGVSFLEQKNELMLRAVERAHSGIRFIPNTEIHGFGVEIQGRCEKLPDFSPMHDDEMKRAVLRVTGGMPKRCSQEGCEFRRRHLTAAHRKIFVLGRSKSRDMPGDRNVEGGIGKSQPGPLIARRRSKLSGSNALPQRIR